MLSSTAIGRLTRDAEIRTTPSGATVCRFTVATEYGYGDKKITTFVSVDVWGKQAEWCGNNLKKGDRVAVAGKGYLRKWEKDDKSGAEFTIDASDVEKLWDRKEGGSDDRPAPTSSRPAATSGYSRGGGGGGGGYGANRAQTSLPSQPEPPPYTPDDDIPF